MKKILAALFLVAGISGFSRAVDMDVWLSSNTSTADSTGTLCGQYVVGTSTVMTHGVLHGVIVSTPTAGGVQLYDSSWTVVSTTSSMTIGPINTTSTQSPFYYDVTFTHGLCYTKSGTATVQFLYQCY